MTHDLREPLLRACAQRASGVLLDTARYRVLNVELLATHPDELTLLPHLSRPDDLPAIDARVELRVKNGDDAWVLSTQVRGLRPLSLRLPGVLQRDARRFERVVPRGVGATWVDTGRGPIAARVEDVSLGGMGLLLAGSAVLKLGSLVSIRMHCELGELRTLARVRFTKLIAEELRVGVEFGELTSDAGSLLGRLLAKRPGDYSKR